MIWLIIPEMLHKLQQARESGITITAEQISGATAHRVPDSKGGGKASRVLSIAGNSAQIHVKGMLTASYDFFADYFGGGNTTYPDIQAAIAEAEIDKDVTKIIFLFDTPGGTVHGLVETCEAIASCTKPTESVIGSHAASAGYALASQADKIIASRSSEVGSIGTVLEGHIPHGNHVIMTNTESPDKRPDLSTDAGIATVVAYLDEWANLVHTTIANGRKTTVDAVNKKFGRGRMMLAAAALDCGMIDEIIGSLPTNPAMVRKMKATKMTPEEYKLAHPNSHAAILAQGQAVGVANEKDRINAHLIMGKASGDMVTALAAVADGSGMTETLRATYYAAGQNKASIADRLADDLEVAAGANNTGAAATAPTLGTTPVVDPTVVAAAEATVFARAMAGSGYLENQEVANV